MIENQTSPGLPDERWFAELTNRKLRRAAHRSIAELEADVRAWTEAWNTDPKPFVWTKTADQILKALAAYCQRINDSRHWAVARSDPAVVRASAG